MGWISTRRPGHRSIVFCSRRLPESLWWSAFLLTRRSSAHCAARAGRVGPGWQRFGRGGGTITISMSGFPARAAALNVVGKHRRRQATAAARNSIGGSPKKRVTRDRQHPENRCGLATCRRPVPRSSLRRLDKRCSLGAQGNEAGDLFRRLSRRCVVLSKRSACPRTCTGYTTTPISRIASRLQSKWLGGAWRSEPSLLE